jgi:uncharacterized membrane protein
MAPDRPDLTPSPPDMPDSRPRTGVITTPLISRRMARLVALVSALIIGLWMLGTPPGLLGKAVAVGYAICHRIAERSFLIDGTPMPLCARCTGIYLGVMTGFLFAVARQRITAGRLPPLGVNLVLGAFVIFIGVDGLNSYVQLFPSVTGVYQPQNWLRLLTGMGAGLAMIHILLPMFSGAVWEQPGTSRILDGWRDLLAVCAAAGVIVALVLSERPLILWVLGIASASGVVLILTLVGAVFFLNFNRLNRAVRWHDLAIPLLAGLTLAIAEIGVINVIRFALTGTWDGFFFG